MKIYSIVGPTASGKSNLALVLAEKINGEIVNADSMQVYSVLPILSAHPDMSALKRIPHHLYGYLAPLSQEDVVSWCKKAADMCRDLYKKNKIPILVGGSGLYIKTLINGIAPIPPIPQCVRQSVQRTLDERGLKELYKILKARDPDITIDPNNPMRVMRALEVVTHTQKPLSHWKKMHQTSFLDANTTVIYLKPARHILHQRIHQRTLWMLNHGAIDEVKSFPVPLHESGILKTIGYKEISCHLEGKSTYDEMMKKIVIKTRQYAKRQETWFNNQLKTDVVFSSTGTSEKDMRTMLECVR